MSGSRTWLYLCLAALLPGMAGASTFQVRGTSDKPWVKILGALGMAESASVYPAIVVAGTTASADSAKLADDRILILEGNSEAAATFGIKPKSGSVAVRQISDVHAPEEHIIWEQPLDVAVADVPAGYQVFAREKWKGVPLLAGKRTAHGAVLWVATPPGDSGIERYPYLLQALADLGFTPLARTPNLWAFFDSSYRIRADPDYLARRWRRAGIGVLHVAGWHNMEPDAAQDGYLQALIAACHRNAILVYAWLELPHVSEKFWADHPAWRDKTAAGQDAQLDWRKLMNLQNADCRKEIGARVNGLLERFDWDGVNLAELYFESLEGASNAARFTPMNDDVRADFKRAAGFDPKLLFDPASAYAAGSHPEALRKFLDYRAELASSMQREWLATIDQSRLTKPYLDIVLTHIDDRFEPGIRDALGADVARTLPLMEARRSTLLVEDPATLWALGPERYAKLAGKYRELTADSKQLAIDINIVDRYQNVYPTKKQTGVELFELLHQAAVSFGQVALYFENSIDKQDLALLSAAATSAQVEQIEPDEWDVSAPEATRVAWQGPIEMDGKLWPVQGSDFVLAPAGKHRLTAGIGAAAVTVADFNGEIQSAHALKDGTEISYMSRSRAIAILQSKGSGVEIDGVPYARTVVEMHAPEVMLPAGQHIVVFVR